MNAVAYVDHLLRDREQVTFDITNEAKVTQNTRMCFGVFTALSSFYGFVMGSHHLLHGQISGWTYALSSAIKMPLLFLLTLAICIPLLYVLNVLIGPRAKFKIVTGLLAASIAVTSIVLAACGPIVAFFMLSTKSYPFIILLNVAVFVLAGAYGVWFLRKGMLDLMSSPLGGELTPEHQRGINTIMNWWLVTYGFVGTQMAWIMRPFIGSPNEPFSIFRAQESNFYITVAKVIGTLLGVN